MKKVIGGLLYDTEKATLIAHNRYWDGRSWERRGRNIYLYKTARGRFFLHHTTLWQGEQDAITPLSEAEAMEWYEELPVHEVDYHEAFGREPEDA